MPGNGATQPSALAGIRVLEFTEMASASFCARLLGDAGADVVKVEPPRGDRYRYHGPFPDPSTGSGQAPDPNWSGMFLYLNANKRGMELDLLHPSHKVVFDDLVAAADILVVGGQGAEIERQGLRREVLRHPNPGLIVAAITPFGLTGPNSGARGRRADGGCIRRSLLRHSRECPTACRTRPTNLRLRPTRRWRN